MQVIARVCGRDHPGRFCIDDLTTWDREMAQLSASNTAEFHLTDLAPARRPLGGSRLIHRLLRAGFTDFRASGIEFPTRLSNIARQTVREALAGLTVNLVSS